MKLLKKLNIIKNYNDKPITEFLNRIIDGCHFIESDEYDSSWVPGSDNDISIIVDILKSDLNVYDLVIYSYTKKERESGLCKKFKPENDNNTYIFEDYLGDEVLYKYGTTLTLFLLNKVYEDKKEYFKIIIEHLNETMKNEHVYDERKNLESIKLNSIKIKYSKLSKSKVEKIKAFLYSKLDLKNEFKDIHFIEELIDNEYIILDTPYKNRNEYFKNNIED